MVGDLSAPLGLDHGDVAGGVQVFRTRGETEGEDRRVLRQPQLVRHVAMAVGAVVDMGPHPREGLSIVDDAELLDPDHRGLAGYSTTLTSGWLLNSR